MRAKSVTMTKFHECHQRRRSPAAIDTFPTTAGETPRNGPPAPLQMATIHNGQKRLVITIYSKKSAPSGIFRNAII
jgi:hypothetical protein